MRIFIPLIVTKREISIIVLFLFDTTSPSTYLRTDTLMALGFTDTTPLSTIVDIHGMSMNVHRSQGNFENVDLLGQDFMSRARIDALTSYTRLSATFMNERPHISIK